MSKRNLTCLGLLVGLVLARGLPPIALADEAADRFEKEMQLLMTPEQKGRWEELKRQHPDGTANPRDILSEAQLRRWLKDGIAYDSFPLGANVVQVAWGHDLVVRELLDHYAALHAKLPDDLKSSSLYGGMACCVWDAGNMPGFHGSHGPCGTWMTKPGDCSDGGMFNRSNNGGYDPPLSAFDLDYLKADQSEFAQRYNALGWARFAQANWKAALTQVQKLRTDPGCAKRSADHLVHLRFTCLPGAPWIRAWDDSMSDQLLQGRLERAQKASEYMLPGKDGKDTYAWKPTKLGPPEGLQTAGKDPSSVAIYDVPLK